MTPIALVGCAHIHTPSFVNRIKQHADIHVAAVWDPAPARAQKRADELNAPVVGDVKKIWRDKNIAAVVICSETHRHKELVLAAARAQKHLFVEKPLGMGSKDAWAMARSIEKAGVLFQTGYFLRGLPQHLFLRDQIQKGHFGQITRIRGSTCHNGALRGLFDEKPNDPADDWRWMADPVQSGVGAFGDLGTHSLDILLWLMGDVDTCTAQIAPGTARYPDCDETGEGLIRFKNGVIGTLAAGWDDLANPLSLQISGTEGLASIINGELYFQSTHVEGSDAKKPWTDLPQSWLHAFDLFLDALTARPDTPLVTPRQAADRVAVMEAMYEGARKNKWLAPKVPRPIP
jgi:predicted dehydrogenase